MSRVSVETLSVDKEKEVKPYLAKSNTRSSSSARGTSEHLGLYKKLTVQTDLPR